MNNSEKNEKQLWNNDHPVENGDCGCTHCDCTTVSQDNACGCTDSARDRVRLTDAEIAEDVLISLNALCGAYADGIACGGNWEDALASCERVRKSICEYAKTNL